MNDIDERYRNVIKDLLQQKGFCPESYCTMIGPKDEMFYKGILPGYGGNLNLALFHYITSALRTFDIYKQLAAYIGGFSAIGPVLDFGSGWGRLTRSLVHRLDPAKIRVCDVYGDAVAWQKDIFGVEGFVSVSDPDAFTYREQNSIVFVGSVFSHLPPRLFGKWLCKLYSLVKPDGIMAFSVHAEPLLPAGEQIGEEGVKYFGCSESDSLKEDTYGTTYVTENYVANAVATVGAKSRVDYRRFQKALYENQDLYIVGGRNVDISNLELIVTPLAGMESIEPAPEPGLIRYRGWGIDLNPRHQLVSGEVFVGQRRIAEFKPALGNDSMLKYFPGAFNSPVSWHCDLPRDLDTADSVLRFSLASSSGGVIGHCYAMPSLDNAAGREKAEQTASGMSPSTRRLAEALFDRIFYLNSYPDVADCGLDAFEHYLNVGWREGRDPSGTFSTEHYLYQNSDVGIADICPLVHYVTVGIFDGRSPNAGVEAKTRPSFPFVREAIASALPLAERVKTWQSSDTVATLEESAVFDALAAFATAAGSVVALSHDDYAIVAGGVQNSIAEEARAFADKGWAYLHVCPTQPLPVLAEPSQAGDAIVWVRLDGKRLGAMTVQVLARALERADFVNGRRVLVLHHLMGFAPELVARIAEALRPEQTIAWTHDFFTLCPSYALMRNNVAFCGGPPPDSQACGICAYGGAERKRHLARMERLFAELRPTVLSPSDTALKFWLERGLLTCRSAHAVPLGTVAMDAESRPLPQLQPQQLRVCFLGFPLYHKGWHVFARLALRHTEDPRYSFYQLGAVRGADARNVTFVEVVTDRERPDFMIDAVAANRIDVVVNWSLCYETFSFTAHEAIAGGAFVLARKSAGNIVPAIMSFEQGLGLDSEQDLFDMFAAGDVFKVAKRRRRGKFVRRPATAWHIAAADL